MRCGLRLLFQIADQAPVEAHLDFCKSQVVGVLSEGHLDLYSYKMYAPKNGDDQKRVQAALEWKEVPSADQGGRDDAEEEDHNPHHLCKGEGEGHISEVPGIVEVGDARRQLLEHTRVDRCWNINNS